MGFRGYNNGDVRMEDLLKRSAKFTKPSTGNMTQMSKKYGPFLLAIPDHVQSGPIKPRATLQIVKYFMDINQSNCCSHYVTPLIQKNDKVSTSNYSKYRKQCISRPAT